MRERSRDSSKWRIPSKVMLDGRPTDASDSVVVCSMEGTRPLLIEIQALVSPTSFNMPRRTTVGIDFNRVKSLTGSS